MLCYSWKCFVLNLHLGSLVLPLGPDHVVHNAKKGNATRHQRRIVHRGGVNRSLRGPEAEEPDDDHEKACKRVVDDAENAGDVPWTPSQSLTLASSSVGQGGKGAGIRHLVALAASTVEQERC